MQDITEPIPKAQRCPKCGELSLIFDKKAGMLRCRSCGFEQKIPVMR